VVGDPSGAGEEHTIWDMQREIGMTATRKMKLDTLKKRIGSSDYEVDADAVAEAIVRRLLRARGQGSGAVLPAGEDPFLPGGGEPSPGLSG